MTTATGITPLTLSVASSYANNQAERRVPWIRSGAIITFTDESLKESPSTAAWYDPKSGDIYVNVLVPLTDITVPSVLGKFRDGEATSDAGLLWGMIAHEAAHSHWTTWVPADLDDSMDNSVVQAMVLFEEIRIEKRAVDRGRMEAVRLLRQSFRWLIREITAGELSTHPFAIAHTWALTYGRYIAGIAALSEVEAVDSLARTALGDDTVDTMREILSESVGQCSIAHLTLLGQEWVDLLKPLSPEEPPLITVIFHGPEGAGTPGETVEGGGGGTGYSENDDELAELFNDVLDKVGESMDEYVLPPQPETPLSNPQVTAAKVFTHGAENRRGVSWTTRKPKQELRERAMQMARALEALSLPSITLTHTPSTLPPGRLRGREMVRQGAERDMGLMSTATPWRRTKRRHSQSRPVIVGIATDTSGSMSYAENFVAEFAWTVATAGHRIGARTAAVTFGEQTEMVTRPGELPEKVAVRLANSGHENFDTAMAALEGVLHFTTAGANSAKILFVVSDGNFVKDGEVLRAQKWLRNITASGTLVVWFGVEGPGRVKQLTKLANSRFVHFDTSGKDTAKMTQSMTATVLRAARSI